MSRSLSIRNLYDKKYKQFEFDGLYQKAMGNPERSGIWIIWGKEKNGKTWSALTLADYLSKQTKVLYISAEEGMGMDFRNSCKRAGLSVANRKMHFEPYIAIDELKQKLKSRKAPKVVFIDNCTVYGGEIKPADLMPLTRQYPDTLFIFLAHEEKGEPYRALAKEVRKLAKIIMYVEGLTTHISGRCPGGVISIDEQKSVLYWGTQILTTQNQNQ